MVLGVEHIAVSCVAIAEGTNALLEAGYRIRFIETDVPNHPSKHPLLNEYHPSHAVAYCQHNRGISMELTQHSACWGTGFSPYQVLLTRAPRQAGSAEVRCAEPWDQVWEVVFGCKRPMKSVWPRLNAPFWFDAAESNLVPEMTYVRGVLLPVSVLRRSEQFWVNGLGCQVIKQGALRDQSKWVHVAFRSPVFTWGLEVVLVECQRQSAEPKLDDAGFPCLALVTNRLRDDARIAKAMGGQIVTDEFSLEIGGKTLTILLLRGPDRELIELIEIRRRLRR